MYPCFHSFTLAGLIIMFVVSRPVRTTDLLKRLFRLSNQNHLGCSELTRGSGVRFRPPRGINTRFCSHPEEGSDMTGSSSGESEKKKHEWCTTNTSLINYLCCFKRGCPSFLFTSSHVSRCTSVDWRLWPQIRILPRVRRQNQMFLSQDVMFSLSRT